MTNFPERQQIIKKLQEMRNSTIITFFALTDRTNSLNLNIADDAIRPLHSLLEKIGEKEKIELFLYTRGGSTIAAYNIVKLIREYTKNFTVIVPFRAHSAGTQISLGANKIVMTRLGQLSPVDPSTTTVFNPILNSNQNPADLNNRKPISVEDVQAYLNLSKERVGLLGEDKRLEVFKELTKYYEPLALGNVNRVHMESRLIAQEVLALHMDEINDAEKIGRIVKALTETYTHHFLITRDIAEKIGLNIERPNVDEEVLIMKLFGSYEKEMKMITPLNPETILKSHQQQATPLQLTITPLPPAIGQPIPPSTLVNFKIKLGAIESINNSYMWIHNGTVVNQVPNPQFIFKIGSWYKYEELGAREVYE